MHEDFDFLTMAEVAKLMLCSKTHICNAVAGRVAGCAALPVIRLGRRKLVRRQSLFAWIEANEKAVSDDKIQTSPVRGVRNA